MLSLLLVLSQSAQTVSIDAKCDEPTLLGNVLDEIKQTFSQCWLFLTAPGCTRPLHATHSLIMATQSHYETLRLAPPTSPYLLVLKFSRFLSPHIHSDSSTLLSFFPFQIFFLCTLSSVVIQPHCCFTDSLSTCIVFSVVYHDFYLCFPAPPCSGLPHVLFSPRPYPSSLPPCWQFILWQSCNVTTGCLLLMVELYFEVVFEVLCFRL